MPGTRASSAPASAAEIPAAVNRICRTAPFPQAVYGGDSDDAAVAQDRDLVGGLLDLAEHVGTEEDGLPVGLGLADHGKEFLLDEGVQPARRFVQHQQFGIMHEGLDEPQLLLVALGELAGVPAQVQAQPFGQGIDPAGPDGSADGRVVRQQLAAGDPPLQEQFAGQIADPAAQRGAGGPGVLAEHRRRSGGGPDDVQQAPHDGRLARAVGPDHAKDGALFDTETDAVQHFPVAELLGQGVDRDGLAGGVDRVWGHGADGRPWPPCGLGS